MKAARRAQSRRIETADGCRTRAIGTQALPEGATIRRETEARHCPRYDYRQPLLVIPVLPDGTPDEVQRRPGQVLDLSVEGMGFVLDSPAELRTMSLVVVLHQADGTSGCLGVQVCHSRSLKEGRLRVGAQFGGPAHELLAPDKLVPSLEIGSSEFRLGHSQAVLDQWVQIGMLQTFVWDRVMLCPRCASPPTFRHGCPNCGSARLGNDQLIHHYACAHVGPVDEFETPGQLICPKCRTPNLIIGSDFEYTTGPHCCSDCSWITSEPELVGHCSRCGLRFPGHQAHEKELIGYRAHRLDPLALLP
jgi:hypothetical protein